jgi:hypothetical protein
VLGLERSLLKAGISFGYKKRAVAKNSPSSWDGTLRQNNFYAISQISFWLATAP